MDEGKIRHMGGHMRSRSKNYSLFSVKPMKIISTDRISGTIIECSDRKKPLPVGSCYCYRTRIGRGAALFLECYTTEYQEARKAVNTRH